MSKLSDFLREYSEFMLPPIIGCVVLVVILYGLLSIELPPRPPQPQVDICKQVELFNSCMSKLPAGPRQTHYNDWSEVVYQCNRVANEQATRMPDQIKPECRSN